MAGKPEIFSARGNDVLQQFIERTNRWGTQRRPFLFVIDYEMQRPWAAPLDELPPDVVFRMPPDAAGAPTPTVDFQFEPHPMPFETYGAAFEQAMHHLQRGDTYLLNLTFPTRLTTNLDLRTMFRIARAPYKLYFQDRFTVFSPECFVRIADNIIRTFPMKGTARADDPAALREVLDDNKERWEHATVVDLLRNDLAMVAAHVEVVRYRYPSRVSTHAGDWWQISSEIAGRLSPDWHHRVGSLLVRLLPAGSISGAPKARTVQIIRDIEKQPRGWFTGVFGVYGGRGLESAVMIRYVERRGDGTLWFRSGGGITAYSRAEAEYREMIQKVALPL